MALQDKTIFFPCLTRNDRATINAGAMTKHPREVTDAFFLSVSTDKTTHAGQNHRNSLNIIVARAPPHRFRTFQLKYAIP
jgi:hypothetical protein